MISNDLLRILDIHKAQNRPLSYILFDISINILYLSKNLNAPFFAKRSINVKSALTFENGPLVAELKFKM